MRYLLGFLTLHFLPFRTGLSIDGYLLTGIGGCCASQRILDGTIKETAPISGAQKSWKRSS